MTAFRRIGALAIAIALGRVQGLAQEPAFRKKPTVTRDARNVRVAFEADRETDVAVYVEDAAGKVVRHLAAGVLGRNPPKPLRPGLSQRLVWDGRDDSGKPVAGGLSGCKIRVKLGMRPTFDSFLLYEPDAMPRATALAVGPKGNVYVFYQDPTANGNQGGHKVRILDRRGRFVRQILPFPADLPYEKVEATGAFRDENGRLVPHVHNWHSLNFYPDTILARGRSASRFLCPVVDAGGRLYWVITGGRLCAINADGSIPYESFLSPPLFAELDSPGGRPALALSSDGKSIYVGGIYNGRWSKAKPVPCIYRISVETRKAEVFLGDPARSGTKGALFTAPRGVAAADGLLYVADPKANRLAVFKEADKSLVREIEVTLPHVVQVHPKTGAVYVCSYVPEEKPRGDGKCRIKHANLLKYAGYKAGKPAYEMALPRTGLSPNGGTHRIALDATAEPPLIWAPGLPYAPTGRRIACYRDTGRSFEPVEIAEPKRPWGRGPRDLVVDRRRGDLYIKVSGEQWHQFDEPTGIYKRLVKFPKNDGGPYSGAHGAQLGLTPDGNYVTHCWGKGRGMMRWTRALKPLTWNGSDSHRTAWGGMMTFQLNYMAVRGDEIYLIKPNKGPHHLEVYDLALKVKRRVVWNVRRGCCPRVEADGNIYLTAPLRPLDRDFPAFFDGKLGKVPDYFRSIGAGNYWYTYMYGSIVKFPPGGGAFEWIETNRMKNDFTALPESIKSAPARKFHYFQGGRYPHKVCRVRRAEWVRFGYSPYSETYPAGTPVCMCEGTGFDIDAFGRVFYPNVCQFRVDVVDANNNPIGHFGQYGNQDSGPDGRAKTPAIPLGWPTYVAVSDTHAYVNDTIGMRVLRVNLGCTCEESVPVK